MPRRGDRRLALDGDARSRERAGRGVISTTTSPFRRWMLVRIWDVLLADGAGQFRLFDHALCGLHAERLVHKLTPTNPAHRRAVELTPALIWWFYKDLKLYMLDPDLKRASALRARFDRIFTRKTGYVLLDRLLARLDQRKTELPRVCPKPAAPRQACRSLSRTEICPGHVRRALNI